MKPEAFITWTLMFLLGGITMSHMIRDHNIVINKAAWNEGDCKQWTQK